MEIKQLYESPTVEVMEVNVEQGFASSGVKSAPEYDEEYW